MSLGTTDILQKPIAAHAHYVQSQSTDDVWKWVLDSRGKVTTTFVDILNTSPGQVKEVIRFDVDNRNMGEAATFKTPQRTFKSVNSITKTSFKEFTFGQEVTGEFGVPYFKKLGVKLTAGQKFGENNSTLESTETTTQYGGDSITVPANKHYAIDYVFTTTNFSGKFQNKREIPGTSNIRVAGFWDPDTGTQRRSEKFLNEKTKYGVVKNLQIAYDELKNNPDQGNLFHDELLSRKNIKIHLGFTNGDDYYLKPEEVKEKILDRVYLDDDKKKVYVLEDAAEFNGQSGIDLSIKVIDRTNNTEKELPKILLF